MIFFQNLRKQIRIRTRMRMFFQSVDELPSIIVSYILIRLFSQRIRNPSYKQTFFSLKTTWDKQRVTDLLLSQKLSSHHTEPNVILIHILPNIEIGGSQKIVFDIMQHSLKSFHMYLVSIKELLIYDSFLNKPVFYRNEEELLEEISLLNPHIIHFHYYGDAYGSDFFFLRVIKTNPGTRIIENVNNPLQAFWNKHIDIYVYVSTYAKNIQRKTPKGKEMVIYPGFEPTIFNRIKKPRHILTQIGMVYRLTDDKIDTRTPEMLTDIVKQNRTVTIHIVGSGINLIKYVMSAFRAGVLKNFVFYGYIPYSYIPHVYSCFDIFIAPLAHESFGVVVPYAMVNSMPIVAMNTGALPEILGNTGILTDTIEEFKNSILELINNPGMAKKISIGARKRALAMFTMEKMLRHYNDLYRRK